MPKITVVITSYNQKGYLREAVESVLAQTLRPAEVIICDDASTDGSRGLIAEYERRDPGLVKAILHEKNRGIAANRSSGLEAAIGDYVCWLDGDDRYLPNKLEQEAEAIKRDPDVKWAYSQVEMIDAEGKRLGLRYQDPPSGYILGEVVNMLGRAPRNFLVESAALRKIGFFRHDMTLYEDYDLCLRLAGSFKAAYCPEPGMQYRVHGGGLHKRPKEEHVMNLMKVLENFRAMASALPPEEAGAMERKLVDSIERVTGARVS